MWLKLVGKEVIDSADTSLEPFPRPCTWTSDKKCFDQMTREWCHCGKHKKGTGTIKHSLSSLFTVACPMLYFSLLFPTFTWPKLFCKACFSLHFIDVKLCHHLYLFHSTLCLGQKEPRNHSRKRLRPPEPRNILHKVLQGPLRWVWDSRKEDFDFLALVGCLVCGKTYFILTYFSVRNVE